MAIIKLNYLSKALLRTVDVTVVLPTDTLDMDTMTYNQKKEYKTLYLLHIKHFIYYMVSLVIKMIGFMVPVFKDLRVKEDYVS